ncbi:MAG: type IX secretion system membrane protein PorP/SprF [Flavobacteriales bacterium]|jgi:type IX secretion system PorP/SprF family membrane protein|nr:type IX secretion system membrane protein PorP/SprF [Crocinitomicaceae bacterium]NBX80695.1 type IX secretion system membrane protein PorP/SprF [Flavobacteriales bacterium]
MKNIYFATVLTLLSGNIFGQQDKSLSVWYQSPVLYNAGAVATGEEDFSFFTNFRSQWLTIPEPGIGMRTNTLAAEFKIPDGFKGANNFGIGLNVLNDQTGSAKLMTTNVSIPINYTLALDRKNKISIGISPGFYSQSVDRNAQTFENQWNGQTFVNYSDIEIGLNDSYSSIDLGTGVFYQHTSRNKTRIYGGLALNHLTKQKVNFSFNADRIYMQSVIQLGADITTNKRDLRIQPQLLYFKTGTGYNLTAGVSLEHILREGSEITSINKTTTINYGFYYRHKDALITSLGFKVKGIRFGLAFDANLSYLSQATSSVGAIEVYIKTMHLYRKSSSRTKLK